MEERHTGSQLACDQVFSQMEAELSDYEDSLDNASDGEEGDIWADIIPIQTTSLSSGSDVVVEHQSRTLSNSSELVTSDTICDSQHNKHCPIATTELERLDDPVGIDYSDSLVGLKRKTLDGMYELYKQHARTKGFSVRKSTSRPSIINGVTITRQKLFCCSCAGEAEKCKQRKSVVPSNGQTKKNRQRRVPLTRTNCKAGMTVRLVKGLYYEVVSHVIQHNHDFTRREWQHNHRCERSIPEQEGEIIRVMTAAGIPAAVQYKYLTFDKGGPEFAGHTEKDHFNFVGRLKMKAIEGGDSQTVIDTLYDRELNEDGFFFRVRVNASGKLCNIFWRDSMMKEDYEIYGDVTVFDTTYRMKKYHLICGAFVGINNHWKNTMFGCCFMADETTESFVWLFETFKKSMGGVSPNIIFSDQDHAIANGIKKVFPPPPTSHRLCQWHLHQNAVTHFGSLKQDSTFKNAFNKCLKGCYSEAEFESCWNKMIADYGLEGEPWFQRLYRIREKWSTAFTTDFFSAGILSSQRSEATNHSIGLQATSQSTITDCLRMFDDSLMRWRRHEREDEFQCSRAVPTSFLPMNGMLKHASQVYTLTLFRDFEQEFGYAIGSAHEKLYENDTITTYKVWMDEMPHTTHTVSYDKVGPVICCSCKNYEITGWLCFHCIRILHIHSISEIPLDYISKRWTKFAKAEVWDRRNIDLAADDSTFRKNKIPWRHEMTRNYYNLVLKCHNNQEARSILEASYQSAYDSIEVLMAGQNEEEVATRPTCNSIPVVDPTDISTKGRKKKEDRNKSHWELGEPSATANVKRSQVTATSSKATGKAPKVSKKRPASTPDVLQEFGSKTPRRTLF